MPQKKKKIDINLGVDKNYFISQDDTFRERMFYSPNLLRTISI